MFGTVNHPAGSIRRMKFEDVLSPIPFGQGIAETERLLETYFIKTPAFWEVINDESDLILGTKGSGKTAISRIVTSRHALQSSKISSLDDVLLKAANSPGADRIFSNLDNDVAEDVLRRLWSAYLLGVAGNSLLDQGSPVKNEVAALESLMRQAGLRAAHTPELDQLKKISAEVINQGGEAGKEAPNKHGAAWLQSQFDFLSLAKALNDYLQRTNQRFWILIDRLDEAFSENPELEIKALRALLRAHLDLSSEVYNLGTKIFLRSDIFERITRAQRFAGLDHFRVVRLKWESSNIMKLIAERILASSEFARQALSGEPDQRVVDWCIPNSYTYFDGKRYRTTNTLDWCIEVSASRQAEPSPRNILLLLKEAQRNALNRVADGAIYVEGRPLLQDMDLTHGWSMLSRARLEDTLFAEANHLRAFIETFKHQSSRATRQTLENRFSGILVGFDLDTVIRDLENAGFLHSSHVDLFDVAPLYRPALDIQTGPPKFANSAGWAAKQSVAGPEIVRQRAKELANNGDLSGAVSLIIDHPIIPEENATLAANIAWESGILGLIGKVDDLLSRQQFATPLIGRRIALRLAMGRYSDAQELIDEIADSSSEDIEAVLRDFMGPFRFNPEAENAVWLYLLSELADQRPSNWSNSIPVLAASRFLAVVRGLGAQNFQDQANRLEADWFPESGREERAPKNMLIEFLDIYVRDFRSAPITMFPYQVVSLIHVVERLYGLSAEYRLMLVEELAKHVKVGAENHRRSFDDWASVDGLAKQVAERMKQMDG